MNTPVVLLHSSAASGRQWRALAERLRPGREVHAVDFHGHGLQPAWDGAAPMRLVDEAAPVERLLERLGGAHLVGHSYGGAVALKVASRRPGLVRSVVAYEPVLFGLLRGDPLSRRELQQVVAVADAMRADLARGHVDAAARRFIDFWSGAGAWDALPEERRQAFAERAPATMGHFDALFGDPLSRDDLVRWRLPTLLLGGARTTPVAHRLVQVLQGAIPGARRETFESMGHMGPVTHADLFNHRVAGFLDEPRARPDRPATPSLPEPLRTFH